MNIMLSAKISSWGKNA